MNIDPTKFLTAPSTTRREVCLVVIALAIAPAVNLQKEVWIVLPVIGIISLIVLSLVFGPFRRPRR